MGTPSVTPSSGSQTITIDPNAQNQVQSQALYVVQLQGGGHGAQFSPFAPQQTPQFTPFQGQGQALGTGQPQNQILAQAQRDREARRRATQAQGGGSQTSPTPGTVQTSQPQGGSQAQPMGNEQEIARLLQQLVRMRRQFLLELFNLCEIWHSVPLVCLEGLFTTLMHLQCKMQELEIGVAEGIVSAGGGPPDDPPGGSSTVTAPEDNLRLTLRLRQGSRQRFNAALGAMTLQQQLLLNGQQLRAQRRQNFTQALQALTNNPPPPQPTQAWQNMVQAHQNFVQAQQALTLAPPPILPTMNWQQVVAQHQNFLLAQQALANNPPPLQPTQAWQNMVHAHNNYQAAVNHLIAHPPLPLLQGPVVNNANHAPMPYAVPHNQAVHILHGNHGGGQHMGQYNPAPHGATPNQVTQHHFPGHFVTYFPLAWDQHDILSALIEAAQASYHLAWQQPNGNWQHPPVWVTRRGITVRIVVITSVNFHGQLIVWTAWPS